MSSQTSPENPLPKKGKSTTPHTTPFDLYAAAALQGYIQARSPITQFDIEETALIALKTAQAAIQLKEKNPQFQ